MAIPTIINVSPNVGFTGGSTLVQLRGTGFQTWQIPAPNGRPTEAVWPTVEVTFGGVPGSGVAVVSDTRLFVRIPPTPLPIIKPGYGEGVVDLALKNLSPSGLPIAGEVALLKDAFTYMRASLVIESDFARVSRTVVRELRRNVITNVTLGTHGDYDESPEDLLSVVDVARVPAIALFGPTVHPSQMYGVQGRIYGPTGSDFETDGFIAPSTDDLIYTFVGISETKQEALALQGLMRQFFKNNPWLTLDRDPADPSMGTVSYEMLSSLEPLGFMPPPDGKSNIRSFTGSFVIRGFHHEALPGLAGSDRVSRTHLVLPEGVADSPEPPLPPPPTPEAPALSDAKRILTFDVPYAISLVGDATVALTLPYGSDLTALTPSVTYEGVGIAPDPSVPTDFSSPTAFTVTAEDGSQKTYVVTATALPLYESPTMKVGTNFWYHTPLSDNWSGEQSMVAGIDWATAYSSQANIWNPAWLAELAPYAALRFMDWSNTNFSQITSWSERMLPTDPANYEAYIDASSTPPNPGVAYEWLIDLCNRTNKHLWICVPAMADANYWTQLATLIRNKLAANLRVYVEYSNETWNGTFGQFQYTIDQGGLNGLPGSNPYYQGQSFAVLQSLRIFQAFEAVFGTAAMGVRVVRVFAYGGNMDTGRQALRDVYMSETHNPSGQTIDMLAMALYVGEKLDGASPSIQSDFHQAILDRFAQEVAEAIADKAEFGIAKLGAYEGGQHLLLNSKTWCANSAIYDEYRYLLSRAASHFALFMHYTHTGIWTDAADRGSWGALDHTGQPITQAHKYRALVDWIQANP